MSNCQDDILATDDTDSTDSWVLDERILGHQHSQASSHTLEREPDEHDNHRDDDTYLDLNRPVTSLAMDAHDYDDDHDVRHAVQRYDCVSAIGPENVERYGRKVELLLYRYLNDLGANASPGATVVGHSYPY